MCVFADSTPEDPQEADFLKLEHYTFVLVIVTLF